jgi:lauroyl/myristoyl acyltransferase
VHDIDELVPRCVERMSNALVADLMYFVFQRRPSSVRVVWRDTAPLDDATANGRPIIFLQLNLGALFAAAAIVCDRGPTTLVKWRDPLFDIDRLARLAGRTTPMGETGTRVAYVPDPLTLVRCLRELRQGRSVLWTLPDHYLNPSERTVPTSFLGATVGAPLAPALLAQRADALLVVYSVRLEDVDTPTFTATVHGAVSAGKGPGGAATAMRSMYEIIEAVVAREPWEWYTWAFFDSLLSSPNRRQRTPASFGV